MTALAQWQGEDRQRELLALALEFLSPPPPVEPAFPEPRTTAEALAQSDAYFAMPDPLAYGQGLEPDVALLMLQRANVRLCQPPLDASAVIHIVERVVGAVLRVASGTAPPRSRRVGVS